MHADGHVVPLQTWERRNPTRHDGLWSWGRVWRGSWAQRVPLRAPEAAPASLWANALQWWATGGCAAPKPVDRAALVVLQPLAGVVREQVAVVQVLEELVLAKLELQLELEAVVQEQQTDVHVVVLLVLAKRVLVEQEAESPATRALHSPRDLATLVAVAQSADRSG